MCVCIKFFDFFFVIYKWVQILDKPISKKNRNIILDKAKEDYENNKNRLSKQARDRYNSLPEEKKDKKREYRRN